jgi:hypothetical protein
VLANVGVGLLQSVGFFVVFVCWPLLNSCMHAHHV